MASNSWKPSLALTTALHPSTSKDYVLPRLDRKVFVERKEVLKNLVALERLQSISKDYFERVQTEITAPMRSMLLEWMFEVCDEERCSCEVFPLAASFLDRFLSVEAVHKTQLQPLGTACLFVASKVKLINPFTALRLAEYTDESVSVSELLSWELLVVNRLNWDVSSVTAFDFLDQFMHRLMLPNRLIAGLRSHLNYLVALASIDFPTATLPPSVIAACCLQVAAAHVSGHADGGRQLVESLKSLLDLDVAAMDLHSDRIHQLFVQKQSSGNGAISALSTEVWCSGSSKHLICETMDDEESSSGAAGASTLTPTEIEDVVIF